jgi:gas vesicle protein
MGGSYERIEQNTKNAMRRQRAELLVSLEVLMTAEERANEDHFPRWIHWYRPKEREEEDDGAENGVINGVGRQLDSAKKELEARITTTADSAKKDHNEMKKEMQEQNDEIKKEIKKEMQEQNTEMKDRIVSLQGTVEAQQLAMEQMASHLQAIMAAVGAGKIEPEPKLEPEPEHSYEPEPEPEP